jgi:hypothetical protein
MLKHVSVADNEGDDEGDAEDGDEDGDVVPAPSISDVVMQRDDALPSPLTSFLDIRAGGDAMTTYSRSNVQNV